MKRSAFAMMSIAFLSVGIFIGATKDRIYKIIYEHDAQAYENTKKNARRLADIIAAKGEISCNADGESLSISTLRHDLRDSWTFMIYGINGCEIKNGKIRLELARECPFSWNNAGVGFMGGYLAGFGACRLFK